MSPRQIARSGSLTRCPVVSVPPGSDHGAVTDKGVLDQARADGFELIERMSAGQWAVGWARGDDDRWPCFLGERQAIKLDAGPAEPRARIRLSGSVMRASELPGEVSPRVSRHRGRHAQRRSTDRRLYLRTNLTPLARRRGLRVAIGGRPDIEGKRTCDE
jgi:hypothetical protein